MRYHLYLFGFSVVLTCIQDGYTLGGVRNLSDISGVRRATFSEEGVAFLENKLQKALVLQEDIQNRLGQTFSIKELAQLGLGLSREQMFLSVLSMNQIEYNCVEQSIGLDKVAVWSNVVSFVAQAWQDDRGQDQFPTDAHGNPVSPQDCVQRLTSYFTPVAKGISDEPQQFKDCLKVAEARLRRTSAVVMPDALYTVAKQHIGIMNREAFVNTIVQGYNQRYQHLGLWTGPNEQALAEAQNYPRHGDPKYDVREAWLQGDNSLTGHQGNLYLRQANGCLNFNAVNWGSWRPNSERWRGLLGHVIAQTQSEVDNCDFYVDGQLKTEPFKINYAALFDRHIRQELEQLTVFPAAPVGSTIDGLIGQKNWDQNAFFMKLVRACRARNADLLPEAEMLNVLYYIIQQPNAQDLWDGINVAIKTNFGACADAKRESWDDAKRFLALTRVQGHNTGGGQRKHITLLLIKNFFQETLRQCYNQVFLGHPEALEACLFLSNNVAGLIPYFSFIKQNSPACGKLNNNFLPENLFKIFLPSAPGVLLDYLSRNDAWNDLIKKTPRVQMALELDPDSMATIGFEREHTAFMPEAPVGDMVINFPEVEAKRQMVNELIKLGILEKA